MFDHASSLDGRVTNMRTWTKFSLRCVRLVQFFLNPASPAPLTLTRVRPEFTPCTTLSFRRVFNYDMPAGSLLLHTGFVNGGTQPARSIRSSIFLASSEVVHDGER